jgi:hypothetical protein
VRGAAGALLGLLLWIYYSAQIFLFGAALTKAHYDRHRMVHEQQPHVMPCAAGAPHKVKPRQLRAGFLLSLFAVQPSRTSSAEHRLPHVLGKMFTRWNFRLSSAA